MRTHPARATTAVVLVGVALLSGSGCSSGSSQSSGAATTGPTVQIYGSDGNMSDSFGAALQDRPGVLWGMKGTTPLTPLSDEFKSRLRDVNPSLVSYNYAGETYDAVVIAALAAESAHSTDGTAIAKFIVSTTTGGSVCETPDDCLSLARDGKDFQYRGISLRRSGLTDIGEPSSASYGTVNFGRDNHVDTSRTEFIGAGDEKTESKTAGPAAGPKGTKIPQLKIGGVLPRTGRLQFAGPPLFAAAQLAVKDINQAGGVLGSNVLWTDGDDGTSAAVAEATVERFIDQGYQVMIGAGASSVTKAILPKTVTAGRVLISPTTTSDELSAYDDKGLFFRTAPPDVLQAKALADMIMRDGSTKVAIVSTDDGYGTGLQGNVQANLIVSGVLQSDIKLAKYHVKDKYEQSDLDGMFMPIANDIKAFGPQSIVIIGFEESAMLIRALLAKGVIKTA